MDGEIVKIELASESRVDLAYQLRAGMLKKGYSPTASFNSLDLGFIFDDAWPLYGDIQLSQLVVLAVKLKMQITIPAVSLSPRNQNEAAGTNVGETSVYAISRPENINHIKLTKG